MKKFKYTCMACKRTQVHDKLIDAMCDCGKLINVVQVSLTTKKQTFFSGTVMKMLT